MAEGDRAAAGERSRRSAASRSSPTSRPAPIRPLSKRRCSVQAARWAASSSSTRRAPRSATTSFASANGRSCFALDPDDVEPVERAAYDASYKGVTDALTLYLWRKPAFYLTRWAAEAGMTPNTVTAIGALLCVLAFFLFWNGAYWLGILAAFIFMVLDTVDGKLARCTGTSSKWGEVFDHGIDLVHPPFWWWAWAHGLQAYGTPLEPVYATMLIAAIVIGYVVQRVIEGIFIARSQCTSTCGGRSTAGSGSSPPAATRTWSSSPAHCSSAAPMSGWSWSPCGPSCR
jgi:phosphatidylglycerophosphate synthase